MTDNIVTMKPRAKTSPKMRQVLGVATLEELASQYFTRTYPMIEADTSDETTIAIALISSEARQMALVYEQAYTGTAKSVFILAGVVERNTDAPPHQCAIDVMTTKTGNRWDVNGDIAEAIDMMMEFIEIDINTMLCEQPYDARRK